MAILKSKFSPYNSFEENWTKSIVFLFLYAHGGTRDESKKKNGWNSIEQKHSMLLISCIGEKRGIFKSRMLCESVKNFNDHECVKWQDLRVRFSIFKCEICDFFFFPALLSGWLRANFVFRSRSSATNDRCNRK